MQQERVRCQDGALEFLDCSDFGMCLAGITQSFTKIGRFVARRPYAVIIATLAVTAVLGTFIVVDFEEEKDLEDLYTPKRAQSFKDREFVLSQYSNQPMEVMFESIWLS